VTALQLFSAVPGMAVPGMAEPGRDGTTPAPPAGPYQYIGQQACSYLDYLDLSNGHTLSPVPGNYYTMAVVSGRPYLSVPPPGRPWNPGNAGAGGTFAPMIIFRRRLILPPEVSHGHYPGAVCGHCDPTVKGRPAAPQPHDPPPPGPPPEAPQPGAIHHARALLEQSRAAHGHYKPGGCKQCMSGGREGG